MRLSCFHNSIDTILSFAADDQPMLLFEKDSDDVPDYFTVIDDEEILRHVQSAGATAGVKSNEGRFE